MDQIDRELRDGLYRLIIPRTIRDRANPFHTLDDEKFRKRYRFTKRGFLALLNDLKDALTLPNTHSKALQPVQRLSLTLQSLASNAFQLIIGDAAGVTQSTVSRILAQVCRIIVDNQKNYVCWPSAEEATETSKKFLELGGIPGIIGCLDGTHIRIVKPTENEHEYVNRKGYHSINVGVLCDHRLRFIWYSAKYPGCAHDSKVWRESNTCDKFKKGNLEGIIVADSAYKAESFLIKPIIPASSNQEERYTAAVCRVRVHIENAIGVLKRQWPVLHSELRVAPKKASLITAACICLRNAAIDHNEVLDFDDYDDDFIVPDPPNKDIPPNSAGGSALQNRIFYFP